MLGNQDMAPLKVLFIGNSFTARNNLPDLIAQLAAARGKTIQHRLISTGGASLRKHWNAGEALKAIIEGHYDYVVLQEQSTQPIKNAKRMHENVRLFDDAIKVAGAKTVLYHLHQAVLPRFLVEFSKVRVVLAELQETGIIAEAVQVVEHDCPP